MRVLLMGGPSPAFDDARQELVEADHQVVTCHNDDEPVFPCKAFVDGCPLDDAPVDAAVVVRNHAWPRPTGFDRGVTCSIRQRAPLVVTGVGVLNPYDPWTDVMVGGSMSLVDALEQLANEPSGEHTAIATEALRHSLTCSGFEPGDARTSVRRSEGWLKVEVFGLPDLSRTKLQNAARRVIGALRAFDRHARGIDVIVGDGSWRDEGATWLQR